MAFQAVPNGALFEILWTGVGGVTWQNNFWATKPGFSDAELQASVGELKTHFQIPANMANFSNEATLASIQGTDHRTEGASTFGELVGVNGGQAQDLGSARLAIVVTLRTALRGRSFRGRVYVGGWQDSAPENGVYPTAFMTAALAYVEGVHGVLATGGWTNVIVSRFHDKVQRAVAVPTALTSSEVRSGVPGTQRRRQERP